MRPGDRLLTTGERDIARSMFGNAVRLDAVQVRHRKWWPFQPRTITMAPMGHIHFHPQSPHYRADFSDASLPLQALFVHEMVHVWQSQVRGRWYLPLMRHPLCRYAYEVRPGQPFERYGIEQQAEIVRHVFLTRMGAAPKEAPDPAWLESILPF